MHGDILNPNPIYSMHICLSKVSATLIFLMYLRVTLAFKWPLWFKICQIKVVEIQISKKNQP